MQPTACQAVQPAIQAVGTRCGQDALEDMINMGRSTPVTLSRPLATASPVAAHAVPGVTQTPPAVSSATASLPTQPGPGVGVTAAAVQGINISMHSSKKVKLNGSSLIAVEHSTVIAAEQSLPPRLQHPDQAFFPAAGLQQQCSGDDHQLPVSMPPSTGSLSGLTLHVQEDRHPFSPSQLVQATARGPPFPRYRCPVEQAPPCVRPLSAAVPDCITNTWGPYKGGPSMRRRSSGQRVSQALLSVCEVEVASMQLGCVVMAVAACVVSYQ